MRQSVSRGEDLPLAGFVQREAILGAGPHAVAIDQHGEYVIVGKPVGRGEVLKPEARHIGRGAE